MYTLPWFDTEGLRASVRLGGREGVRYAVGPTVFVYWLEGGDLYSSG